MSYIKPRCSEVYLNMRPAFARTSHKSFDILSSITSAEAAFRNSIILLIKTEHFSKEGSVLFITAALMTGCR